MTLPSLRPLIAESMRERAASMPVGATREEQIAEIHLIRSLTNGANTLEWCDANDPEGQPLDEERTAELESALKDIYAAAVQWNAATGTARHGKLFRSIEEIYVEIIDG